MKSISSVVERLGVGNRLFDTSLNILNLGPAARKKPGSFKRFLFLQYDTALGPAINATPVFEALRRAIPDAHIAMAASGLNCQIFGANPYIDEIFPTPHAIEQFPQALAYFLRRMRKWRNSFDCVLTDSCNHHSKVTALQIASGIPVRAGYANRGGWVHYPLLFPADPNIRMQHSVISNNLRILDLLGRSCQAVEPSMFFNEEDLRFVENLAFLKDTPESVPVVAITSQGSGRQPHIWYPDRFAEVGNRLHDRFGARLVFVGGAKDAAFIEGIRSRMRAPSISLAGLTSIRQLSAFLCRADLMLTVDTGTMHVGRAIGIPMVILSSPFQGAREWLPLGMDKYFIIRKAGIPCAMCWKADCQTRECMDGISTDEVTLAAEMQLRRFPPSTEQRGARLARALTKKGKGSPETVP